MDVQGAASVLDWWREAGVDVLVDEAPRGWLTRAGDDAVAAPVLPPRAEPVAPFPSTIAGLRAWIESAAALPDGSLPGRRILPEGDPASGLMILIDMPEPADSAVGRLLSDETGRLFERMLAAVGRDRGSVYLAPLCFARPPGGRIDPAQAEAMAAFALRHAALAAPRRILLMGQAVSRAVLGMGLAEARGKLHAVNHEGVRMEAIATFAPRFLIQNPARKADSWRDLRMLVGGMDL